MVFKDVVSLFSDKGMCEKRSVDDNYAEFVLLESESQKWAPVLEGIFGKASKPRGSKLSNEDAPLVKEFGGLWPEQGLYKKDEGGLFTIAMLWPWQDKKHVTVKMAVVQKKKGFMSKFFMFFLVLAMASFSAFGFNFDDYNWGISRAEVMEQAQSKGKDITDNKDSLEYEDKMFGTDCYVSFYFTPSTDVLSMIEISFPKIIDSVPLMEFKERVEDILSGKYGEPQDFLPGEFETHWGNDESYDLLVMKYQPLLQLTYYGGEVYRKGLEEGEAMTGASTSEL